MTTINGRKVRFPDCDGAVQVGTVTGWREGSAWMKVTNADGRHFMVHCSEPIEILRDEH